MKFILILSAFFMLSACATEFAELNIGKFSSEPTIAEETAGEEYYKDLGWLNCHWSCWDNLQLRFESFIQSECNLDLNTFDRYNGFLLFMGS